MRTLRLTQLAGASLAALSLAAPGLAQDREVRDLTGFDSIDANGGYELVVIAGDAWSVELIGDADDFDEIEAEVDGTKLEIFQDSGFFSRRHSLDVVVQVTMPAAMRELEFGRGIRAEVSGIDTPILDVDISTGASARLSGVCGEVEYDASTGASLRAASLVCERVEADASTGASLSVHATEAADASASMGASIRVEGNPASRHSRSSMGGSVGFSGRG